MNEEAVVLIVMWVVIGGGVGYLIGAAKGNGTAGFFLGLILGLIGWIIAAVMQPTPEAEAERNRKVAAAAGISPVGHEVPAKWAPDPYGRFGHRWWNGTTWTERVATSGVESTDPPRLPTPGAGDGWDDDPFGRYARREYRDGEWTALVANSPDSVLNDPPGFSAPIPPPPSD